jgi:hypothetical protein
MYTLTYLGFGLGTKNLKMYTNYITYYVMTYKYYTKLNFHEYTIFNFPSVVHNPQQKIHIICYFYV